MARRFASFPHAAKVCGVHQATIRNRVVAGELAAFKLPGKKGHFVDLDEATALFAQRQQWGSFGEKAVVHDLSNVVEDFEVLA
ncbi:hypothetical protein [Nocardioides ochotonae]|uniref:hypothetical protein n=1 Tax=Nocardioides ochotonae TaxID=2685869 RepID=UPI00140AD62A|nr:hypothetical protein [Nocardioides ochotonae]